MGAGGRARHEDPSGPVALSLTRQKLPTLAGTAEQAREGLRRGGYVLREASGGETPQVILIGTGSELQLAFGAAEALEARRHRRRASCRCRAGSGSSSRTQAYRDSVLPPAVRARVAVEAGVSLGWERWVGDEGAIIGLDHFGASAPAGTIFEKFGFTVDRVADVARGRRRGHGPRPASRPSSRATCRRRAAAHADRPRDADGDSGVDRTPSTDPGHS